MILIAVALFAALSYAVSNSNRVGGSATETEMAAAFDEIMSVVAGHRAAVQRMIANGVDTNDGIGATYPLVGWGASNSAGYPFDNVKCPSAGTNHTCKIYHPQGGGLTYFNFPKLHPTLVALPNNWTSNAITKGWWSDSTGTYQQGGTAAFDYLYNIRITRPFCDYINKRLGNPAVDSHSGSGSASNPSAIGFTYQLGGTGLSDSASGLAGANAALHLRDRDMGCWHSQADGGTYIFTALILLR